jgi:hypothetical protein
MAMRASWHLVGLAFCALALAACERKADTGGVSPGAPSTAGNTAEMVPGATGSRSSDASGTQAAQPGVGLDGGLGSSMGAASASGSGAAVPVPGGSTNASPGSAVGTRP